MSEKNVAGGLKMSLSCAASVGLPKAGESTKMSLKEKTKESKNNAKVGKEVRFAQETEIITRKRLDRNTRNTAESAREREKFDLAQDQNKDKREVTSESKLELRLKRADPLKDSGNAMDWERRAFI
ncbi:MAG: hypothetical protein Q9227_006890 [Pyrenula ochraceoflavens]